MIAGLHDCADRFDAVLCDIWGVLHDGRSAFAPAVEALTRFRAQGGAVVLITNAPRPNAPIIAQLRRFGVADDAYDAIVTSGDVTIALLAAQRDRTIGHIGPARDASLFAAAQAQIGRPLKLTNLAQADIVVCTGLYDDETETPADYETRLRAMVDKGQPMICANPDIIVHRGAELLYCAGALAQRLEALGGKATYAGKPYAPIYDQAVALARKARGGNIDVHRILAIGDGMRTDIAGAVNYGLSALFVTAGIHRSDLHDGVNGGAPADRQALEALCASQGLWPSAAIAQLSW